MKTKLRRALLVIRHALAMWRALNLPKNAAKGDWRGEDVRHLLDLLQREYEELYVACWEQVNGIDTAQRVAEEAADVSNYAAMIADVARAHKSA